MTDKARLIVITGMSGAGKSTAANYFEDKGFFCVDNLPPLLLPSIAKISENRQCSVSGMVAVVDIREGALLHDLLPVMREMKKDGMAFEMLYLDADEKALIKRYKETRRTHPLGQQDGLEKAILDERKILEEIKKNADYVINTSEMLVREFLLELDGILNNNRYPDLVINIISFGFKYGIPMECDSIFDVRFLPNPHYVPSLKGLTGKSQAVQKYIYKNDEAMVFTDKLIDLLCYTIPLYVNEGKPHLIIGIGCTGGRHRSVALALALEERLKNNGQSVLIRHRDIHKKAYHES